MLTIIIIDNHYFAFGAGFQQMVLCLLRKIAAETNWLQVVEMCGGQSFPNRANRQVPNELQDLDRGGRLRY